MWWSSFKAIFRKEFIHIFRDRGTLIMAFSIPVFQMVLFGFIDQTVRDVATVVVDQDRSSDSRELMDQMRASRTFKITEVTMNPHEARREIIAGRARVGVVIPPDFHNRRARGTDAKLLVLIDGSDSNVSAQALASINGLVAADNIAEIQRLAPSAGLAGSGASTGTPLSAQPIILFNPDGRTANYIIPGLAAILLQIVAMVLAAVTLVKERERGTMEQLLVTPIDPLGLMLGKLGPYLFIGMAEMAMVLTVMRWGFGVPIRGDLGFLFAMATIYLFALLSLGLFVSSRTRTQAEAQQMAQMFLLPSIFLSGYIFPVEGLPFVLRWIGRVLPATHMIAIMRGIVLRDAGVVELMPNVLALIAISTALVFLSVRSFKKVAA
jgi:ABC-2 type transport system permease protein